MKVRTGTQVDYGAWKYDVEFAQEDFPPGTFDNRSFQETWFILTICAERFVKLEALRRGQAGSSKDQFRLDINAIDAKLTELGMDLKQKPLVEA